MKFLSICLFSLMAMITACPSSTRATRTIPEDKSDLTICHPVKHGERIYLFNCTDLEFGIALDKFLKDHPGREIEALTSKPYISLDEGFWLVLKEE